MEMRMAGRTLKDPYRELGVDRKATPEELKKAYRRRAKETHPDVSDRGDSDAFLLVGKAYLLLSDPVRRERFDRYGEVDDGGEVDNRTALAMNMAVMAFNHALENIDKIPDGDVLAGARAWIKATREKGLDDIRSSPGRVRKMRDILKRLKFKGAAQT